MKEIMIPLNAISRFKWDAECGRRLESARRDRKVSRQSLANAIAERLELPEGKLSGRLKPESCSLRYIQKLERDEMVTIPIEVLTAISEILDVSIGELLNIDVWIRTKV